MDYVILMADILESREKDANELMLEFKKTVKYINDNWQKNIICHISFIPEILLMKFMKL